MRSSVKGEGAIGVAGFFEVVDSVGLEGERRWLGEEDAGVLVRGLIVDRDGDEARGFWNVGAGWDEAGRGGEWLRRGSRGLCAHRLHGELHGWRDGDIGRPLENGDGTGWRCGRLLRLRRGPVEAVTVIDAGAAWILRLAGGGVYRQKNSDEGEGGESKKICDAIWIGQPNCGI